MESEGNTARDKTPRERLLKKLSEEATVSGAVFTSSDAISVRSVFKGIGAELILIDAI